MLDNIRIGLILNFVNFFSQPLSYINFVMNMYIHTIYIYMHVHVFITGIYKCLILKIILNLSLLHCSLVLSKTIYFAYF